jgi:hypothetical protein
MDARQIVLSLVKQVSQSTLRERLFYLAKDPLPFRKLNFTLPGHAKSSLEEADDYIARQLARWGYGVSREGVQVQAFRCDSSKPKAQQYSRPQPEDPWYTACNIYGKKTGAARPDEIIVLVSHKDSQSWVASPGAFDNAAGTSGNMEVARVLRDYAAQRSIWFLYVNEEHWPWTSKSAAKNAAQAGLKIIAVLNLDGLSAKAPDQRDKVSGVRYTTPEGERLADRILRLNEDYGMGLVTFTGKNEQPSNDDGSFIQAGYPAAVHVCGQKFPQYHTEEDVPEKVDVENLAMATRLCVAATVHLDREGA